jgi:hypothetical protein
LTNRGTADRLALLPKIQLTFTVTSPTPFEIEVDLGRNLARTHYRGNVSAADMQQGVQQVEAILPQLRPDFIVLADLSELDVMEIECGPHIAKIMDLCKAHGVGMVVRIIPDPKKDIGMNILSLVHYRGQVKIVTCETRAEAEKLLS